MVDHASASRPSGIADHLRYIDGLRGLAVLMVMCRHYYMGVFHVGLPRWADGMGLGYLGVHLFLMLSGFCIAWAYVGPAERPFATSEFAFRRAARILPPYYAALAISMALWLAQDWRAPGEVTFQLLTHLTMTHNFSTETVLALNGPFWSLALECQLYVLFPLLLVGFRRWGVARTLAAVFAGQMLFRFAVLPLGTDYNDLTFVVPWSVLGRVFEFAVGMWAAQLVAGGIGHRIGTAQRWALCAAGIALTGGALVAKRQFGVTHPITDLCWDGTFFCLMIGGAAVRSALHRLLSLGPIVTVGVMCYSTYLIHGLVLPMFTEPILHSLPGVSPMVLLPLVFGLTLIVCYVFYRGIEHPSIQFFKKRRLVVAPAERTLRARA